MGKKLETLLYLLLAVALQLKSTRYVRLKKGLNRESSILLSNEMHLANGICAEPQGPPSSLYDVGKGYRMGVISSINNCDCFWVWGSES